MYNFNHTHENDEQSDGLHLCPVCDKVFLERKAMYQHILRAHQDGQRLASDLGADLYQRWQERIQRPPQ